MKGIIQQDGNVRGQDGKAYMSEKRSVDKEGYSEILIDATAIGGTGIFQRKSVKPFIGASVEFDVSPAGQGYNYKLLKL